MIAALFLSIALYFSGVVALAFIKAARGLRGDSTLPAIIAALSWGAFYYFA